MRKAQEENCIFGEFILKSRLKKGWSLYDLEEKTGITPSYINRLERGIRKNPTVSITHDLARAFNVEMMTLVELILLDQEGERE